MARETDDGPSVKEQKQYESFRASSLTVTVHTCVFLYSLFFWMQQGVFPHLLQDYGAETEVFGYLETIFAVIQLGGGPIFGRFGDVAGGKAAMKWAFAAAGMSYCFLAIADTVTLLFLSRIPSLFMHTLLAGQMIVCDLVCPKDRVRALGRLSLSYGLGMTVGPVLGGWLENIHGEKAPAWAAIFGSIICFVISAQWLPDITKPRLRMARRRSQRLSNPQARVVIDENGFRSTAEFYTETKKPNIFDPRKYLQILHYKRAYTLLVIRLLSGIPIGVFQSIFPLVALEIYKIDASYTGVMTTYVAVLSMMIQGLLVGTLRDKFTELQLIRGAVFSLIWCYLAMIFVTNFTQLFVVLIPVVYGLSVLNIVIGAALTNSVPEADSGAALGLNMAINSLIRSVTPAVGTYVLAYAGFSSFGFLGAGLCFILVVFMQWSFPDMGTCL